MIKKITYNLRKMCSYTVLEKIGTVWKRPKTNHKFTKFTHLVIVFAFCPPPLLFLLPLSSTNSEGSSTSQKIVFEPFFVLLYFRFLGSKIFKFSSWGHKCSHYRIPYRDGENTVIFPPIPFNCANSSCSMALRNCAVSRS